MRQQSGESEQVNGIPAGSMAVCERRLRSGGGCPTLADTMFQPPPPPGVVHAGTWRDTLTLVFTAMTAIGTIAVAIAAVWGDWLRTRFAPPRLTLRLREEGVPVPRQGGPTAIYHHIRVENGVSWRPAWSPAEAVRVLVVAISRRGPDGEFHPEPPLAYDTQLTWSPTEFHEVFPTINDYDQCDLGSLDQGAPEFRLSVYAAPRNFPGSVAANQAIRVTIIARARNGRSRPLTVQIAWDGQWFSNPNEIKNHLVVSPVNS